MSKATTESATPCTSESLREQVEDVIQRIRPAVQSDGGDIELIRIREDCVAEVRLHGACVGCPSSQMTLQMGVERTVREKVPQIQGIEQID